MQQLQEALGYARVHLRAVRSSLHAALTCSDGQLHIPDLAVHAVTVRLDTFAASSLRSRDGTCVARLW